MTAILRGRQLHVANVGDSRAYLCRAGKAKALTVDHSPADYKEHERIEKVGPMRMPKQQIKQCVQKYRTPGRTRPV